MEAEELALAVRETLPPLCNTDAFELPAIDVRVGETTKVFHKCDMQARTLGISNSYAEQTSIANSKKAIFVVSGRRHLVLARARHFAEAS